MHKRGRNPGFARGRGRPAVHGAEEPSLGGVSDAVLKQARKSGQLNLSNRGLSTVPDKVWRINLDAPAEAKSMSWDNTDSGSWWEQVDLTKLILASNSLTDIPAEIKNFVALTVFDVSRVVWEGRRYL